MQLIILGSKLTLPGHKAQEIASDNESLMYTSTKMAKAHLGSHLKKPDNFSYQYAATVTLKTPYNKIQTEMDEELMEYLKHQLNTSYEQATTPKKNKHAATGGSSSQVKSKSGGTNNNPAVALRNKEAEAEKFHHTLHIYSHGSTFGLSFTEPKENGLSLTPKNLASLLEPYLKKHPECTRIKLHVCFTGIEYPLDEAYGKRFADELHKLQIKEHGITQDIEVEGVKGMSLSGEVPVSTTKSRYAHFAITASKEALKELSAAPSKKKHAEVVEKHKITDNPKPKWTAKK